MAEVFLKQAKLWEKVDFQVGYAQNIFHAIEDTFDICYNDADKGDYPEIWQMAKKRINPGGLYIADNVLWHSRVAIENPIDIVPGWTEAILEHNRTIFQDPRCGSRSLKVTSMLIYFGKSSSGSSVFH